MTLQIDFAPQTEEWINAEALHYGLNPVDLVRRVMNERATYASAYNPDLSPEERIRAMDALAEAWSDLPHLSDEAFDRESIYEGRP